MFSEATGRFPQGKNLKERSVQGNQEDSDLLVAFGNTIILVECKAGGDWGDQIGSKIKRIELLKKLVESHPSNPPIEIHFAILCPKEKIPEQKAHPELPPCLPHVNLKYNDSDFKRVTRCDENGKPNAKGSRWQVEPE